MQNTRELIALVSLTMRLVIIIIIQRRNRSAYKGQKAPMRNEFTREGLTHATVIIQTFCN